MATAEPRRADELAQAGAVALDQLFDADGLFGLRSAVAAHGGELGLAEQRLGDLILVAHELASNAVRHGGATATQPARLRLWRDGDLVFCEVSDHGPGLADPSVAGRVPVAPTASNGRGLWIIRQIAETFDIATGEGGTTMTAAIRG